MSGFDPLYIAALAREMRDGEAVHVGAAQDDVWLAVRLARALWAPRLRVVAAGTFLLDGAGTMPSTVPRTYTRDVVAGRDASFHQSRVFNDLRRSRVAFAGGMQVDARGNANLVGIYQDGKLIVRGPGSGGLPTLTSHTERFFIAVRHHSARVLVERVSRISVLGDPEARAAAGLPPHALRAVITPLARFEPSAAGLQLVEVAPGVTLDALAERTGFALAHRTEPRERRPLEEREAAALLHLAPSNDRRDAHAR
jgi:acyl CoA:acetate/3-ketoacid CoA transferase beta subunit